MNMQSVTCQSWLERVEEPGEGFEGEGAAVEGAAVAWGSAEDCWSL
jgi:hypothetical protein